MTLTPAKTFDIHSSLLEVHLDIVEASVLHTRDSLARIFLSVLSAGRRLAQTPRKATAPRHNDFIAETDRVLKSEGFGQILFEIVVTPCATGPNRGSDNNRDDADRSSEPHFRCALSVDHSSRRPASIVVTSCRSARQRLVGGESCAVSRDRCSTLTNSAYARFDHREQQVLIRRVPLGYFFCHRRCLGESAGHRVGDRRRPRPRRSRDRAGTPVQDLDRRHRLRRRAPCVGHRRVDGAGRRSAPSAICRTCASRSRPTDA